MWEFMVVVIVVLFLLVCITYTGLNLFRLNQVEHKTKDVLAIMSICWDLFVLGIILLGFVILGSIFIWIFSFAVHTEIK